MRVSPTEWHNPFAVPSPRGLSPAVGRTIIIPTASDDFASGNQVATVGGTAEVNLDPGAAGGNAYTVHYFVSVTINASSTFGTMTLVVAIETNNGSGWVERGTYTHYCDYPSGPPPYSSRTCTFSHQQPTITVAGLGLNADIRLKAKSFTGTPSGHTGSFTIRGGDAAGSNPETYNGVTYIQTTPARITQTGGYTDTFTVKNAGGSTATYTLGCSTSANISCFGVSPLEVTLASGAQTTVVAAYNVGSAGTGTLRVLATSGAVTDTGTYSVPVNNPTAGAPIVDFSPQYGHFAQNMTRCAMSCFAATYSQSTVPYFSLDAPRSITLAYHGDRVNPKPFVHVNVRPDSTYGQWPAKYQLQVKVNGTFVTFLNGEQTLNFAYPGNTWVRLGGQFDMSTNRDTAFAMDIIVSAYYSAGGGTLVSNTWTTKLLVVNDNATNDTLLARGWGIAGIQRLYGQAGGSALITEGDGSAVYFAKVGSVFVRPAGEFSQLFTGQPGGGAGWTRAFADSTKIVFNSSGQMIEVRDRFNNITTIVYDGNNRVSKVRDPLNIPITLTYDGNGLTAIQDSAGRITDIVAASKRLTTITDPDNVSTTFGYDGSGRLSTITNRRGNTTTLTYDAQSGKLATIASPSVTYVAPNGDDSTGSLITSQVPWQKGGVPYAGTGSPFTPPTADTVYARATDPGGDATRFTVNSWGAAAVTTDPLGRSDSTWFNTNGLPIRTKFSTGAVDSATYNANGLATWTKLSGYQATNIRYGAWAQADSIWRAGDSSGVRRSIGANGRVDWERVAGGTIDSAVTRFRYDSRGRPDSVLDAMNHLVKRSWFLGANGGRSKDSSSGGELVTYSYDTYGRLKSTTRNGFATDTVFYSIINRPDSVRDGLTAKAVRYTYDNMFLTSLSDSKNQTYGFAYNANGWLTQRTDPAGRSEVYKYSRDGLLRRWVNRRNYVITYTYDAVHRLTQKSGDTTVTEAWAYPSDTVIIATTPVSQDTVIMNRHSQAVRMSTVLAGQVFVRRYVYTSAGNLDSVVPSGGTLTFRKRGYVWNTRTGVLKEVRLESDTTRIVTNPDGLPTAIITAGSDTILNFYTSGHAEGAVTVGGAEWGPTFTQYVNFSRPGKISERIFGSGEEGRQYTYDGLGRLIGDYAITWQGPPPPCAEQRYPETDDNGSVCVADEFGGGQWVVGSGDAFSYDSAGNRRDKGGQYGAGNRITQFDGCTYETDFDGNITQRVCGSDTVKFKWSAESRLISMSTGGQTLAFHYNSRGELVRKDVNGSPAAYFVWDQGQLLAELNGTVTTKTLEYSYLGLDIPHAVVSGSNTYHTQLDATGNVMGFADSTASPQGLYEYGAWGQSLAASEAANRARFKGALWMGPEQDLYFMRARWYEPKTGRFLSEDPLGLDAGINQYVFANNDPINLRDPEGLDIFIDDPCPAGYHIASGEVVEIDGTLGLTGRCESNTGSGAPVPYWVVLGYTMTPVTVTSCQICSWSESLDAQARRVEEALRTVNVDGSFTTFSMEGLSITLRHVPTATLDPDLKKVICSDARFTATLGKQRADAALALVPYSIATFRKGTGFIGMRYAWKLLRTGAGTTTFAYGVYQALGC